VDDEFARFDKTMRKLIQVPHSKIKAKLEAEKATKKRKPKETSASDRASGEKD
jgi:Skp family chaperone for outer membrane proteins